MTAVLGSASQISLREGESRRMKKGSIRTDHRVAPTQSTRGFSPTTYETGR